MRPTTSKKTIIVGFATLVLLVVFFVISVRRGTITIQNNFTPPVYANGDSPTELIRPLHLTAPARGAPEGFSVEDTAHIAEFKRKMLARVSSGTPLTSEEKTVLAVSIATTARPAIGALVIADQTVLHFTSEELAMISRALGQ